MRWRERKKTRDKQGCMECKLSSFIVTMFVFLTSFTTVFIVMAPNVKAAAPTNETPTYGGWDSGDNCYAQKRWYYINVTYRDSNGYQDFDYVELSLGRYSIGPPDENRAIFRYDEDDNTASVVAGAAFWELDTSSSNFKEIGPDPNVIEVSWKFKPKWAVTEESDLDIKLYCRDGGGSSDTDYHFDVNFDVVKTLVTNSIECNDSDNPDRVDPGASIQIDFEVTYADGPSSGTPSAMYPPDGEFTSVSIYDGNDVSMGTDTTITNGAGSVAFTVPSTAGSNIYNLYVDMYDIDYVDGQLQDVEEIITDKINISWSVNKTTIDAGDSVAITLDDLFYDSNRDPVVVYQYDVTRTLWGQSGTTYKDDYSSDNFTFIPTKAGIYNFTISSINDSIFGITANYVNQTIQLTVKQNISLVKNANNNGVNYITWGANDSIMASKLADDLSLESTTTYVQKFNSSSGNWTDFHHLVGVPGTDFEISRWDHLRILTQQDCSHSFTPDSGCSDPQNIEMNFTSNNKGYNYITWNQDYNITAAAFLENLSIDSEDITIYVYNRTTNNWNSYNPQVPPVFNTLSTIQTYDVICFQAPNHANVTYNPDGW